MAKQLTPVCDFGWQAPDFILSDPAGATWKLSDHLAPKGLLIAFICNHCPYVKAIADRLAADALALIDQGVHVAAVMSNDFQAYPADAPDQMVAFAEKHQFAFPYLVDTDQSVARAFGAVCTPEFFGFNASGALQYRGRLDDSALGDPANRKPELLDAMAAIAQTGEGPRDQTSSMGCSIKWRP